MKPDEYTEDKPKNHFEWGYLYKVYLVILIAVFLLALANQANAGVFLEIGSNMEYVDSQLPVSDIINDSDTWDAVSNYMNDVHGVPFPSYSDATAMDDLLENVLMFYVGQYCNLSGTAAAAVYDAAMDVSDAANTVWELLTLDLGTGDFIATPGKSGDLSGVIHGVVDPLIYDEGNTSVGSWRLMDQTIYYPYYGRNYPLTSSSSYDVWVCIVREDYNNQNRWILWSSKDPDFRSTLGGYGLSSVTNTYTANGNTYYWVLGNQMYSAAGLRWESSSGPECGVYSNHNTALAALWGSGEPSSDSYLNGEGYIINENPTYLPLSGFSALNYPYRTKIVENHTNTTDPDDPVTYPVGVNTVEPNSVYTDVPTWLVDPSVDIPEEPDYLENVDVELPEIEPDTGFITDCYNALPSGIVSMIAVGLGLGVVMKIIS